MPAAKGTIPWNAGKSEGWTDKRGYEWLYVSENGKRRARRKHRVIVEKALGRRLEPWELVHHKDENPSNNELSNLEIKEFGQHTVEHHLGSRHSYDSKRRMEAFGLMREELKAARALNADMLAALEELLALAELSECSPIEPGDECHAEVLCGHSDCDAVGCVIEKINCARAAIAKATGAA